MDLDAEYAEYKAYIDEFAKTIDPHDQLPLRTAGYCLREYEVHGEVTDWLITYLGRGCPVTLRMYLVQNALKKILEKVSDAPDECGYDSNRDVYQPLKLVRVVVAAVNSLIIDLQDNAKLYEVPLPANSPNATELTKLKQPPKVSIDAIKNSRRTMEDRHVISDDFNGYFNTQDTEPTFYYGIFDGHSGSDAASYANSHLNYNIAVHPKYPSDIKAAMTEAFLVTDIEFLKKAKAENLSSGCTALCAIYRKTQKKLYIGWCGDSQALIARIGSVHQIVRKHSPEDPDERKRIEALGGVVLFWGNSFRVNGQLAVSRAIGDISHKPFVSAEPEIVELSLDGEEDFIVLGCDGLWDSLTEDDVALTVYTKIRENPNNYSTIASDLCALAKKQGSRDNISVIVVYLKEPDLIATQSWPSEITAQNREMDNLNMYEPEQVAPQQQPIVSMDALGNTNQDIFNNPFGDYSNQLISDVATATMGKSTEITDMVLQQQPMENVEFCTNNLTTNLNSINNNKLINNGSSSSSHDEEDDNDDVNMEVADVDFMMDHNQQQPPQQQVVPDILNDDNNNSNSNANNLGPETDVDAIIDDEEFHYNVATGGEKERSQMEFKETSDVVDHIEMNFGGSDIASALENKIFGEMFPEMKGGNPFATENFTEMPVLDNKLMEEQQSELQQQFEYGANDFSENVEREIDFAMHETAASAVGFTDELISSANNEEVAINKPEEKEEPQSDLGLIGTTSSSQQQQQPVALGGESGVEESEDEDEEWNYIKVEEKQPQSELGAVEENIEVASAPVAVEDIVLEEPPTAPIEEVEKEFEFNLSGNENQQIIEHPQEPIETLKFETDNLVEEEKENLNPEELQPEQAQHFDQLEINTADDMESSQLNPDAKEFIPVSPVSRSNEFSSPPPSENGTDRPLANPILSNFDDAVVSQSPRKGELIMEDVAIPATENEFDQEADARPHEVNLMEENFQRIDSPSAKEAMQIDEKLEQSYTADDSQHFEEEVQQHGEEYKELEKSFDAYSNGFQSKIDDAMNRSFYEGRDGDILANSGDLLNTVQPIPSFEDEQPEADHHRHVEEVANESDKPEADLLGGFEEQIVASVQSEEPPQVIEPKMIESNDHFEAEKFVEEIKGASESKYVDTELSPTIPEFDASTFSSPPPIVEETIVTHTSFKETLSEANLETMVFDTSKTDILENPTETPDEFKLSEFKDIPETVEPVEQEILQPVEAKIEPKTEILAVEKKAPAEIKKKEVTPAAKKPLASKAAPLKTTEVKPKPISKPSSAPVKPPVSKTPASSVKASSATASRPTTKPAASTVPLVKKTTTTTLASVRPLTKPAPKPAVPSTTVPTKRPVTSASTARPAPKPAVSKVANGTATTTERKPLTSSAPAARAPPKPTSLTVKSKLTNGSAAPTAAKPAPRLSATSPSKTLSKPASTLSTVPRSPRPATTTTTLKSAAAKSPSTTAPKTTSMSTVGVKKPMTITKKSPVEKTSTTVIKKSPGTVGAKAVPSKTTTIKKTTTTVVVKKQVVNGEVAMEETETISKTTNEIGDMTNGHFNGNGLMENGGSEQQAVIEPAGI